MRTKRFIIFLALGALLVAMGLVVMGTSIILSCFGTLYGHPPDLFDLKKMIEFLTWVIPRTQNWLSVPISGWILVTIFTPIVISLVLLKLYRCLMK